MRLIVSILTTIIVSILSCLAVALFISQEDKESGVFFFAFVMILGNIILPLFLAVVSYAFLKGYLRTSNSGNNYLTRVGGIVLISALGVAIMTIAKAISYYWDFSEVTLQNLKGAFESSYRGYIPVVVLYSFLIPIVYQVIEKRIHKFAERQAL